MKGDEVPYVPAKWYPEHARSSREWRPEPGWVIGRDRVVWRVVEVTDLPRDKWTPRDVESHGMRRDKRVPFEVVVEFVAGVEPEGLRDSAGRVRQFTMTVHYGTSPGWQVYPGGRWPMCSCCGEPMPCRAELTDQRVDAAMHKVESMQRRLPGCCWGCGDPVTSRQQTVLYAGENLDLPGGPDVRFHLRGDCVGAARAYELKWLSVDHSRRRMLTWPGCKATLYWHADGSSECHGSDPECRGHTTHAHGSQATCASLADGCSKGCIPGGHGCGGNRAARRGRRVEIRDPDLPQGVLPDPPAALDRRPKCPGTLLVHTDGSTECKAGGRDDCWGGDAFRHERRRGCRDQSHGCPTCDMGGAVK